jgi:hypothetical protein
MREYKSKECRKEEGGLIHLGMENSYPFARLVRLACDVDLSHGKSWRSSSGGSHLPSA